MLYKDLCEQLYRRWRDDPREFADFDSDFNVLSLPEPYFPLGEGSNPLVVLNNNPGGVLDFQGHKKILQEFADSVSYAEIAEILRRKYSGPQRIISGSANARNKQIMGIARALGHDCVENVETFFLHSSGFDKKTFIRHYLEHADVVAYHEALRGYLADRPVVIVAAVASGKSLSKDTLAESRWLQIQASLAGLEVAASTLQPITKIDDKMTSGAFRAGSKILLCTMGNNNIPRDAAAAIAS